MGSFQVYDALNILFKLEKPFVKHLEGFILLPKENGELQKKNLELLTKNTSSRPRKNSPVILAKAGALMVGKCLQ
jgi:hypothetical protein